MRAINVYSRRRRLYQKVYEKIARDLDPDKSQCSRSEPNVLLISFAGPDMNPNKPGWTWPLDFLFNSDLQTSGGGVTDENSSISLRDWVHHNVRQLCHQNLLTTDLFNDRCQQLLDAPNYLGGIMLFRYCRLVLARVNYNAHDECRLSHAEMAELERLLSTRPSYSLD